MRFVLALAGAAIGGGLIFQARPVPAAAPREPLAGGALTELTAGNRRFVAGKLEHARLDPPRRELVAKGQHPFAIVVGCSDSRVPPEILFDQGLGDLFVVRVAGQVVDGSALASVEYAAEHLGATLVVVLGHERCGAVKAALDGGGLPGHLGVLAAEISPAIKSALELPGGDPLDNAVRANVQRVVLDLTHSEPLLAELVHAGRLEVIGARYDLDTGEVEFWPRAPSPSNSGGQTAPPRSPTKPHNQVAPGHDGH